MQMDVLKVAALFQLVPRVRNEVRYARDILATIFTKVKLYALFFADYIL
jgi:hypothetical protein